MKNHTPVSHYISSVVFNFPGIFKFMKVWAKNKTLKLIISRTEDAASSKLQQLSIFMFFKGYFRCKTITSQNVSYEAHVENIFIS